MQVRHRVSKLCEVTQATAVEWSKLHRQPFISTKDYVHMLLIMAVG